MVSGLGEGVAMPLPSLPFYTELARPAWLVLAWFLSDLVRHWGPAAEAARQKCARCHEGDPPPPRETAWIASRYEPAPAAPRGRLLMLRWSHASSWSLRNLGSTASPPRSATWNEEMDERSARR